MVGKVIIDAHWAFYNNKQNPDKLDLGSHNEEVKDGIQKLIL